MAGLTLHSNITNSTLWAGTQSPCADNLLRIVLVSTILCTSLFGNTMVLMVLQRKPQLLHVANRFVFNLLLADLLQTVTVMPLVIMGSVPGIQPLNRGLCKVLVVLMHLFAFAGVNTIVVVSIDRYLAIIHPLSYPTRMTPRRGNNLIVFTWLLGTAQSTPPLYGWGQVGYDGHNFCSLIWPSSPSYTLLTTLFTFWLPVSIMLGCYWMVLRAARRQNALVHPANPNIQPRGSDMTNTSIFSLRPRARHRSFHCRCKAARVVFVIMSSYILSMGPYSILSTMTISSSTPSPPWLTTLALILFYCQCCIHPYIYGYMHRNIRREFLILLCGSCCRQLQPRNSQLDGYFTMTDGKISHSRFSTGVSRICPLKSWEEAAISALTPTDISRPQSPKGYRRETLSTSCSSENEPHLLPSQPSDKGVK
ncbi:probable G-protein coupled receptor 101 [Carcharodon carcharias]|uniref:probable G-protein coupled receptor 101 n=1 Tax=Carcharodon carcharias TaxID=13397 RepID=UPI001B7F61F7|nr:probable G-protein coupled receptor 101 [Carcharodon carcharias]